MEMNRVPTFARLLDWLEGLLDPESSAAVADAVQASPSGAEDLRWIRAFLHLSTSGVLASPGPEVRGRLEQCFDARRLQRPGPVQRLLATISFDSLAQPLLAGARSAGSPSRRHLVYSSEVADVVLDLYQVPPQCAVNISGQVLPTSTTAADSFLVELIGATETVDATLSDETGEFDFEPVPAGEYRIVLRHEAREITIGPLALTIGRP